MLIKLHSMTAMASITKQSDMHPWTNQHPCCHASKHMIGWELPYITVSWSGCQQSTHGVLVIFQGWLAMFTESNWTLKPNPVSKVHGANMGPIWGRQDPGGPHVGPVNFAIWECKCDENYNNLKRGKSKISRQIPFFLVNTFFLKSSGSLYCTFTDINQNPYTLWL